jgi:cytochrome subunit of sulfide dehydrogenase
MQKSILLAAFASCLLLASSAQAEINITGLADACNNCHGTGGVSAGHAMPSIAGLPESYLKNIMMEWKTGARASANMTRLISGYTDEEIAALAKHFAKLPWKPVAQKTDKALVAKGKAVADKNCSSCHGDTGASDGETPGLNGQWAKYMELELMKYRDDGFNMPNKQMRKAAKKLDEADVKAVAEFYASQNK